MQPLKILVVDDEKELRDSLTEKLTQMNHSVACAENGTQAIDLIRTRGHDNPNSIDIVFLDVHMPGLSGLDVLNEIRSIDPTIIVLIFTAHGNIRDAVDAMRDGAYNYIEKPLPENDLEDALHQASQARSLVKKVGFSAPKISIDGEDQFIGSSRSIKNIFAVIEKLGHVNTNVLIRGENGTGKELVARAIHYNSTRKNKHFVALNCGAIPENLIESEFFGHEKGAFTGANQRQIGKFQFAEGGTLFLDEIGDISPAVQVKLLRVLQERKFTPLGSNREIKSDVRVISATNQNLETMILRGLFRQDLFYRLNVMPIELPALRERKDDIPFLVEHFIDRFNHVHQRIETERSIRGIHQDAMTALKEYAWPGNIRELENVIERAFVLETSNYITVWSLPDTFRSANSNPGLKTSIELDIQSDARTIDFHTEKELFERDFIIGALKKFHGKINQTVALAGIPKNTLLRKIKKYGIKPCDYGSSEFDTEDALTI